MGRFIPETECFYATRHEHMFGTPEKAYKTARSIVDSVFTCQKMERRGHSFDCNLCHAQWVCWAEGYNSEEPVSYLNEEMRIDD